MGPLTMPDTALGSCRLVPTEVLPDSVRIFYWTDRDRQVQIRHTKHGMLLEYSDALFQGSDVERVKVEREGDALRVVRVTSDAWQLPDSTIIARAISVATTLIAKCVETVTRDGTRSADAPPVVRTPVT